MKSPRIKFLLITPLILGVFLLSIFFVSGQPEFLQNGDFIEGYDISINPIGNWKQYNDFDLHFNVFNKSNGIPIDNSSTDCFFHFYDQNGSHLIESEIPHIDTNVPNEWAIKILKGNLSIIGNYVYKIQCNSSDRGGYENVEIKVTTTGKDSNNRIPLFLLGFSILILMLGYIFKSPPIGFLAGILLCITGIYVMIYGLGDIADLYTQVFAYIIIAFGTLMLFIGVMSFFDDET